MTQKDLDWIAKLRSRTWTKMRAGFVIRVGGLKHREWEEESTMDRRDWYKLQLLFDRYKDELVFVPAIHGFGLALFVYVVIQFPYPNVPDERIHLITVTTKQISHIFPGDPLGPTAVLKGYIYTENNKEAYKAAGFLEPLRELSYYEY